MKQCIIFIQNIEIFGNRNRLLLLAFLIFTSISFSLKAISIDTDGLFLSKLESQTKIPSNYKIHIVKSSYEVYQALSMIHMEGGFSAVVFKEGIYSLSHTLNITAPNVMLLSLSANPMRTILMGNGMKPTNGVDNLIRVSGKNFVLDGLTLQQSGNHLIQIAGENGANHPIIRNCLLQDGYEQLIKVTYDKDNKQLFSNKGIIENCMFQYTAGIGPNFYIGGIDAHGIKDWKISNNIFENIASPSKSIAEHAIHIWRDSYNNTIENNIIINSDRGIGLGMGEKRSNYIKYSNLGGVISNNIIYHERKNNHKFADTGIILESSPETIIKNNIVYFEHNYPNAIEFRFEATKNVIIINNITNRGIVRRNGAEAMIYANIISSNSKEKLTSILQNYIH